MNENYNPFSLAGKKILVTGASSGIGRAIAVECSKLGAELVITGRNAERLNETFASLAGENHQQIIADLSLDSEIDALADVAPKLDGCVCNAGAIRYVLAQFADKSDVSDIFSINTFSPITLINSLLQKKKITKNASIVFTSSVSGLYGSSIGEALYSASKAAINGYVKGLALELAGKGIRVNSINPAIIETKIFNNGELTPEQLDEKRKQYPLRRFGKPEDAAFAAIYLLSDAAQWITGTHLLIDGGYTLN